MKTKRTFGAKAQRFVCGLFAAVALLLTGCNKDTDEGTPYIMLSPSTDAIAFSADATESYVYEITTNQPVWLASSDQEWCVVTMDAYNNSFTVTALRNGADTPPPPATITVSAGSLNTMTITATQAAVTDYEVYVSGSYEDEQYQRTACYWKNGVRTLLLVPDGTTRSDCQSVAISNGVVYMAGDIGDLGCYWKDGKLVDLSDQELATAKSIAIDNDKVHLCGSDYYWTDNNKVDAPTGANNQASFIGNAIAVSNGSVFIAGDTDVYIVGRRIKQAASWNGTTSGSEAFSIPGTSKYYSATCAFASNGSFYAGGYYITDEATFPCYWKDKVCTTLETPQGMTESTVGGICVVGSTIYVAGTCGNEDSTIACYWENDIRKELELPSGVYNVEVKGITVAGGRICVAGQYQDETDRPRACYWINGKRTDIPKGTNENAYTTGIALVVK